MSDLTTLATLERVVRRCRDRAMRQDDALDAQIVFELLLQELHREMEPKPPIQLGDKRG